MGRLVLLSAVLAAGCGRIDFTPADRDPDAMPGTDAPTDAGAKADVDADASGACPAFALFCDDFESGDLSRWSGTVIEVPATATVNGTQVHRGASALDATVPPAGTDGGTAVAYLTLQPPQSTGVIAVREWLAATSPLALFNMVIVLHHDTTDQYAAIGGNNAGEWVVTDDPGTGITTDHDSTVATPAPGTWSCVEVVYTFPPAGPRFDLYVNDELVVSDVASDPAPAFTNVQVGIARADNSGIRVFTDDVVIADRRIGCE